MKFLPSIRFLSLSLGFMLGGTAATNPAAAFPRTGGDFTLDERDVP